MTTTTADAGPAAPARPADPVAAALGGLAAGRAVVVLDDTGQEDAAHLVLAAEHATPPLVAFAVRHTSGLLRAAIDAGRADALRLPPMTRAGVRPGGAVPSVAVDAVRGVGTGISAADRARTIAALADPRTGPDDLARPGHVVPLRVDAGGVLGHRGPAEAAADLAALAGLHRAVAFGELVGLDDPTRLAGAAEARLFALEHELAVVSVDEVAEHRMRRDGLVERGAEARLPLPAGTFRAVGYRARDGREHLALVRGTPRGASPVHVHRECALGEVAAGLHCTCRAELDAALAAVAGRDDGVVVLLRAGGRAGSCGSATGAREARELELVAEAILADLRG
ncbi:3,4-dihydroxy-2-butanone-4-phosphate synthase [Saccharopolyspora gregorii]|uniref:3,4-dihydroxy-2-butanone-4-phosphate synthase n=1 Tax=Saccharopolyspora gregorii TaxID=33914 RepID=UPI0021ABA8D6|nr:3,4-dihydroxy-2-butanone-4-phosphate synthase [Saccharopolyspora gregorii]